MTSAPTRRLRSALVALTMTAAATGTAIAVAGPAHAESNDCTTTTVLSVNGKTSPNAVHLVKYGYSETVAATVSIKACMFVDGVPPNVEAGTLKIERSTDNGDTWTTFASVDASTGVNTVARAGISGKGVFAQTDRFRAHFIGGSSGPATGDTFHDSTYVFVTSAPVRIAMETSKNCTATGCTDTWKITPVASISGLRVKIQRKVGGVWTTTTSREVTTTGTFTYKFVAGQTLVVIPAARGFASSSISVSVSK